MAESPKGKRLRAGVPRSCLREISELEGASHNHKMGA